MNITIKATNTELSDKDKEDIMDKLAILDNFLKPEDKIHLELEEDKKHNSGRFKRIEIHISPHGQYAESRGGDFFEALDLALPKIREQLKRGKDKKITLRRRIGNIFKSWRS